MLVTTGAMFEKARSGGHAVGAFNIENLEMAQAVIAAACEARSPAMLCVTSSTAKYCDVRAFFGMVSALAQDASVPLALHLDHGSGLDICVRAIRAGFTSVMIDGSHLPFEENLELSREVARIGRAAGVPVEAELGRVGGKEDEVSAESGQYTDVDEAVTFVRETGISSLAVAIGTAHGVYAGQPVLSYQRLGELRAALDVPLVLHGASGLSDEAVRECVRLGIAKVNYATELRLAFTRAVKKVIGQQPEAFDPKVYLRAAREAVKQQALSRIDVLGCAGHG